MCQYGILKSDSVEENVRQLFRVFDENNDGYFFIYLIDMKGLC